MDRITKNLKLETKNYFLRSLKLKTVFLLFWLLSSVFCIQSFTGLGVVAAYADTNVSGLISSNTTWTLANSPYSVTNNVLVNSGATLTIEPGVTVKVNSGKSIQIDGTLIAKGTSSAKITFTSSLATPAAGDWGYILFSDSSTDATYDGSGNYTGGSILEYVTVEYAGGASVTDNGAVRMNNAHPFINYCTIRNNKASGVYGWNISGILRISNNNVLDNVTGSHPDHVTGGIAITGGTTLILNNSITNNNCGIFLDNVTATISSNLVANNIDLGGIRIGGGEATIDSNNIKDNALTFGGGDGYGGGINIQGGIATIINNTIAGNTTTGKGGAINNSGGTAAIGKNIISNNTSQTSGGGIASGGYYGGSATISDNIIINNKALGGNGGGVIIGNGTLSNNIISNNAASENGGGVYTIDGGGYYYSPFYALISKNSFSGNISKNAGGLYYYTGQGDQDKYINTNLFQGNKTTGLSNTYTLYINLNTGSIPFGSQIVLPHFNSNNIFNNTATYELWNDNPQGSANVEAKGNWWGTADDTSIQNKIYDWFDDSAKGIVDYSSYSAAIRTDAPVSPPAGLTATAGTGSITLNWTANPESDIAGYKVYWATASGFPYANVIDVGNVTTYTLTGLTSNNVYVTVTAYDTTAASVTDDPNTIINEKQTAGNESWYAGEKTITQSNATITLKNIPSTAKEASLSLMFSGQGEPYTKIFNYTAPVNSTITETLSLPGVYDKYTLDAVTKLDMNGDGTEDATQAVAVNNTAFTNSIEADFGLPASVTVSNMPSTAKETALAVQFLGGQFDGSRYQYGYTATFNFLPPFNLSILGTLNPNAGVYDKYTLDAVTKLDTNSDGTADETRNIMIKDKPFSQTMAIDFNFHVLTIIKSGTGVGTVTADTGTITWNGNIGTASYSSGTIVTLTAAADTGSTFTGWSGACTGTQTACTVTMDAVKSVTATFGMVDSTGPAGAPIPVIPRTGQTGCYAEDGNAIACTGTGQDGEIQAGAAWPSPRFVNNGDGTITDRLTGLMWTVDGNIKNGVWSAWQDALNFIKNLNASKYLGYSNWRLPNINEIRSLINGGTTWSYMLGDIGFEHVTYGYWSSTNYAKTLSYAWTMPGDGDNVIKSGDNGIWPVRTIQGAALPLPQTGQTSCYDDQGNKISCAGTGQDGDITAGIAWPAERFKDNGNGTVTDMLTALVWSKDAGTPQSGTCSTGAKTWQEALDYVKCLNIANYLGSSDWRLPNINELLSLPNKEEPNSALWLNNNGFSNVPAGRYWSSNSVIGYRDSALYMNMESGSVGAGSKAGSYYYAWPVRTGNISAFMGILINADAAYTNSASVNLMLSCSDSVTGCSQMQFSNDNVNWSMPEVYSTRKTWTLAEGAGSSTVYVRFKDNAGNWSSVFSDTILLDTTGPVIISTPTDGTYIAAQNVTLTANETATIYYTTDGSTPTTSSTVYTSPISISATTTLKFFAKDSMGNISDVSTVTYNIQDFSLSAENMKVVSGDSRQSAITVKAYGGFSSDVTLSYEYIGDAPLGATVNITPETIAPASAGTNTILTFSTTAATPAGTCRIRLKGTSGSITRTKDMEITVFSTMTILTDTLSGGIRGQAFSAGLEVAGGIPPYTFTRTAGSLPDGLSLNSDGTITGTPSLRGSAIFTIQVQDSAGHLTAREYIVRTYDASYKRLAFEAASWETSKGSLSGWITIKAIDDYGAASNVSVSTMINISSSSATGRFTKDGMTFSFDNTAFPEIPAGYNSVMLKYMDSASGVFDITASGLEGTPSEAWESGTHSITVKAPDLKDAALTVSVVQNASYGQGMTVTGMLRDTLTNAALNNKTIYVMFTSPSGTRTNEYPAITGSDGKYSYTADTTTLDAAGNWDVKATFRNDTIYNEAYAASAFIISKADTSLSFFLDTSSTSPAGTVNVSGKLSSNTILPVNLSGIGIVVDFTEPDGTTVHTVTTTTYDSLGHFQVSYNQFAQGQVGPWSVEVRVPGTTNLNSSESVSKDLTVSNSAGYAIIIEGDSSGQYRANYTASLDDIYNKLLKRAFTADNIYYLSYEGTTHVGVDAATTKQNIENAVKTWAYERISQKGVAPLYIIMMDHGSVSSTGGVFHIDPDTITPDELNAWIGSLEESVRTNLGNSLTTIVINGSCYSGSFIAKLSKQGRVIITSSAEDEESAQGPSFGNKTYGEYFIYYLFNNLAKGSNMRDAFRDAATVTHKLRECSGTSCGKNSLNNGDNSRQHPLLDDNGDGKGSWMNIVGQEDGETGSRIILGLGTNPAALSFKEVMPTARVVLGNTLTAYAKTTNPSITAASWIELRKPSYVMPDTGGTGQVVMNLPKQTGSYNETEQRWEYPVAGLNEAGTYTIYFYAMDINDDITPPGIGTIYVDTQTNQPPSAPVLISPALNDEVREKLVIFRWDEAQDPDNDPVTYTIRIYEDSSGIRGSEIKNYELIPQGGYFVDSTVEKNNAGAPLFLSGSYYWWEVEAVDSKGAKAVSASNRFRTTFTNALSGILYGYITDLKTGQGIEGADITVNGINVKSISQGYYIASVSTGTGYINAMAGGYNLETLQVYVSSGAVLNKNIGMTHTGGQYTLTLNKGWNFVSVPGQPTAIAIETLLNDISANVRIVWGFDNQNKQWQKYKGQGSSSTGQGPNTLTAMEAGKGYWIYMNSAASLTVPFNYSTLQPLNLFAGWNLFGYAGHDWTNVETAVSGINGQWVIIWSWDNGIWKAKLPPDANAALSAPALTTLNKGKAYWIKMKETMEWQQ